MQFCRNWKKMLVCHGKDYSVGFSEPPKTVIIALMVTHYL